MNFSTFFRKLCASDPDVSSKRVVALTAFVFILFVATVDLFSDRSLSTEVFDGLLWIVLGGLGLTTIEKFTPVSKSPNHESQS